MVDIGYCYVLVVYYCRNVCFLKNIRQFRHLLLRKLLKVFTPREFLKLWTFLTIIRSKWFLQTLHTYTRPIKNQIEILHMLRMYLHYSLLMEYSDFRICIKFWIICPRNFIRRFTSQSNPKVGSSLVSRKYGFLGSFSIRFLIFFSRSDQF